MGINHDPFLDSDHPVPVPVHAGKHLLHVLHRTLNISGNYFSLFSIVLLHVLNGALKSAEFISLCP
jgi:hypothetical protein